MRNVYELREKAKRHSVEMTSAYTWSVHSGDSENDYTVGELADGRFLCNCEWGKNHPTEECSHTIAAKNYLRETAQEFASLLIAAFLRV